MHGRVSLPLLLAGMTAATVTVEVPVGRARSAAVIGRLAREAPRRRISPRPPRDPRLRIVVSEVPPAPPKPKPRAAGRSAPRSAPRPPYWRGVRYGYSRRPSPLYLRKAPGGEATFRLQVGLLVRVLGRRGRWQEVETAGRIRARGWVPAVTLGLRVQRTASLYPRPGGRPFGKVARGQLLHVAEERGAWVRVRLMGWLPLSCWMRRTALGTARTAYGSLPGRYPSGSRMVVTAGPLHAAPGGAVVARALDEGRVYRVRVRGRWSEIAMMDYRRVDARLWVPTARLRWGASPYFGSGTRSSNCEAGTSGDHVALAPFWVYAARDDAWPTVRVLPGARFRVAPAGRGWVRIYSYGCLRFSAYAEEHAGDYARATLMPRR